jgi:predicted nucleotidyltransferase
LCEVVDAIKGVDGVVGVVLFGSTARGEADEGSDLDLLVFFEDEEKLREGEWEVTRRIPPKIFAQSICVSPSTAQEMNPTFLRSVLEEGILLYARYPLALKANQLGAVPSLIISYSLAKLPQKEKQAINYKLFGRGIQQRRYRGLVGEVGGRHLGRGCMLLPEEAAGAVLSLLGKHNVKYQIMRVSVFGGVQSFLAGWSAGGRMGTEPLAPPP